jgi:transmembrane sensor
VPNGLDASAGQAFSHEETEVLLAWRAPRVEFSGAALAAAVELLNQQARASGRGVQLVIADPALGRVRVSGLFRLDNTEAFVRLLEEGFGIRAERNGEAEIRLRAAPTP